MNNLPIKFLSVEIQNFRGVPDSLRIPLDAPLTIIHAANGTGKSTICYALEWLLTNKVDDLPTTTNFSCQWGGGDTVVSAECQINGELYYLNRVNGQAWIKKHDALKRKKIKDADLLEMLTPISVTGGSTQATTKARRDWLRNCRWLYANSLALLVDNSKSELRQQIFADILGLGHLTSTLSNLKEYRGELPKIHGLEVKLQSLSAEIQALEGKLSERMTGHEQVTFRLTSIFEAFPGSPPTGILKDDFKTAQLQVAKLLQMAQRKKDVLAHLQEGWSEYESSLHQLETSRNSLSGLTQVSTNLSEEHRQLSEQLASVDIKLAEGKRSVDWARQKTEVLSGWEGITSDPHFAQQFPQADLSFQHLQKSFVEYGWELEKQQHWLGAIEYLVNNGSVLLNLLQLKNELSNSPVQPPVNIVQILKSAEEAKQAKITAQAEFDALSNVLDRLRALGREAAHSLTSGHCPLCDHDWKTGDALREQLSAANLTPELQASSRRLAEAQSAEQLWSTTVQSANLQKASFDDYTARVESVNSQLQSIEDRTNYLKVMNKPDFSDFNINNLPSLLARIKTAIGAKRIAEVMAEVEGHFQLPPSENVSAGISNLRQQLERYTQHFQAQLDWANAVRPGIASSMSEKLETIQAKTQESHQVNASIAAVSQVVNRFQSQWNEVISILPISKDLHTATQVNVDAELKRAEGYDATLRECQAFLAIDSDSQQLLRLQRERAALVEKLKTGQSHIRAADNAITRYGAHVRDATISSLAPLLVPATELFSRMHANEVYHQLSVSGDDLNWMVLAEDHDMPLEAQEKLSQGQRQDLALSLYLARAKNTGGSFILDEPIAHLDDLNRVAMLDIFRLVATSMPNMNLILTTASDALARHLAQKFSSVPEENLLNTIYLEGNPRMGVKASVARNATGRVENTVIRN